MYVHDFIEKNKLALLIFFSSLFIFISFSGTRMFFSDEGVILNQFHNLINGSLALKLAKINTAEGVYIYVGNNLYGIFSYSLLIISVPVYYFLKGIDFLFGAHLFLLLIWAVSGGIIVYLAAKTRRLNFAVIYGLISCILLAAVNLYFFDPIYFPKWGELLSIEFTNILISSFIVLFVYLLFRELFGSKTAIFASIFIIAATPISFYAITLKHHSLSILLTLMAFYYFYKYTEKKRNIFIYFVYILAGLCIWVRIVDGAVLLISLIIIDIANHKRSFKYIITILIIILISLIPYFTFNYLVLGNPFSVIERIPLADRTVTLYTAKDPISLEEDMSRAGQTELLNRLGFTWNTDINANWLEISGYSLFSKLNNTFGVFLFSPFLIIALSFILERIRYKINLNIFDKFFGIYVIILFGVYSSLQIFFNIRSLISIITDTPIVLEYRYLLILYVVFLYFALRNNNIREQIENKFRIIAWLYGIILIINLILFIVLYPVPFMKIYYFASLGTSLLLLILILLTILRQNNRTPAVLHNLTIFFIAAALAEATTILLYYYWVVSMTYISPSQNHTILPVLEYFLKWMYHTII